MTAAAVSSQEVSMARSMCSDPGLGETCAFGPELSYFYEFIIFDQTLLRRGCAFGEENDAFEEVHRSVQLRIFGIGNAFAVSRFEAFESARRAPEREVTGLFGREHHGDIRRDPFLM